MSLAFGKTATNMTSADRYVPIAIYEPLFELKGGEMIKTCNEWNNGGEATGTNTTKLHYSNDNETFGVRNTTGESFYTFKVAKDSEVFVHTIGGTAYRWQHENMTNEGWVFLENAVPCISSGSTGAYPYPSNKGLTCSKFYPAGSTVTIRVPHAGLKPHVYVRPL